MSIILNETTRNSQGGYFRIGFVTLTIPPEDIITHKVENNEEITPLRAPYPFRKKTGQSRWDVSISWKAMVNYASSTPYAQWEDLRSIVAMFKAAPFVEVENKHIRQILSKENTNLTNDRMAFALRQLRIDTNPDMVDTLEATLIMTLFNHSPYSKDFGYQGSLTTHGQPAPANANNSYLFYNYIQSWKTQNLDQPYYGDIVDETKPWADQTPGTMSFAWRDYEAMPLTPDYKTVSVQNFSSTSPSPTLPPKAITGSVPSHPNTTNPGAPTALAAAVSFAEGTSVSSSVPGQSNNPGDVERGNLFGLGTILTSDGGHVTVCPDMATGWQLLQNQINLIAANKSRAGYPRDPTIGQVSDHWSGSTSRIWGRNVAAFLGVSIDTPWKVAASMPTTASQIKSSSAIPNNPNPQGFAYSAPAVADSGTVSGPTAQQVANVQAVLSRPGWYQDHRTDFMAFIYKPEFLLIADEEHGHAVDTDGYIPGTWPTQISITFVNNIATIPLENFPYPTFQHIGPAGTQVNINFTANDNTVQDGVEPQYPAVSRLSEMLDTLDTQYFTMHHQWRSSATVHRMQACVIENQILNMFGIRGVLPDSLTTETMPQAFGTIQVGLSASQYENTFEDVGAYKVSGLNNINTTTWLSLLRTNTGLLTSVYNSANAEDKSLLQPLMDLSVAMTTRDPIIIYSWLISDGYMSNIDGVQTNPAMPIADITTQGENWTNDSAVIANYISAPAKVSPNSAPLTYVYNTLIKSNNQTSVSDDILGVIRGHGQYSFTDYFVLSRYPIGDADMTNMQSKVDSALKKIPSSDPLTWMALMDTLYNIYYDWLVGPGALKGNGPTIRRAQDLILQNSKIMQLFNQAGNIGGPGLDVANAEHGAYRDLGLRSSTVGGADFNPAYYFYDDSADFEQQVEQQMVGAVEKAVNVATMFNIANFFADDLKIAAASTTSNKGGNAITTSSTALGNQSETVQGRIADTMERLKIPKQNMVRAFPTFKLFLIEENNTKVFNMLDDFYSYSNVLDIEIIRYRDKPDTAVFVITNMSHLLSHKLFDNTAAGRREFRDDQGLITMPNSTGTTTSPADASFIGSSNLAGNSALSTFPDYRDSMDPAGMIKAPPRYFAMQTGTKVQIRMGYANNPDLLFPVFTGLITDIQGDEILTVTAQGFMLELMGTESYEMRQTGYMPVSGSGTFKYTGGHMDGTTQAVMSGVLTANNAKHFGHWQVAELADKYLKGFTWQQATGLAIDWLSPTSVLGALLETSYDRRDENILINHVINADGSADPTAMSTTRPWHYEQPYVLGTANYKIPKDPSITPWMILSDVARRYPEYNLMVRQYGFPYSADATLVYADPNDWYISRPRLPGNTDDLIPDDKTFKQWWGSIGQPGPGQSQFLAFASNSGNQDTSLVTGLVYTMVFGDSKYNNDTSSGSFIVNNAIALFQDLNISTAGTVFPIVTDQYARVLAAKITQGGYSSFNAVLSAYISCVTPDGSNLAQSFIQGLVVSTGNSILNALSGGINVATDIRQGVSSLKKALDGFVKMLGLSDKVSPADRLQPVRKWHYVNEGTIIHNGITLNENIYNAVKILDKTYTANDSIPNYHLKALDTTPMIIQPNENVISGQPNQMAYAYAQSFMREEVGKMYRGDLVIMGLPEIEPFDVVVLNDPWNSMVGPIEVDSVIHSFSQESGYITIIRPRALVAPNDQVTAPALVGLGNFMDGINTRMYNIFLGQKGGWPLGSIQQSNTVDVANEVSFGVYDTLAVASASVYWAIAACSSDNGTRKNFMAVCPMARFNRPWVGGLTGWKVDDLIGNWEQSGIRFWEVEFEPNIESFRIAKNLTLNISP